MPDFFHYNRHTGIVEYIDQDPMTGSIYIHHKADDMQPFLDRIAEARNTRSAEKGLLDNGKEMHLYAVLDPITIMKMRAKGIDIYSGDKDMQRKMFDEINANYPKCKVTEKTHR